MQATLRMMVRKIFGFFKASRLGLGVKRPGARVLLRSEGSIILVLRKNLCCYQYLEHEH